MSVNITDSPTFTSPIVAPAGGDLLSAAAAGGLASLQGLANRTAYLQQQFQYTQRSVLGTGDSLSNYATLAGFLTNIPGISIVSPVVGINDLMLCWASCNAVSTGGVQAQFRITASSASHATARHGAGEVVTLAHANGQSVNLVGVANAGFAEAYTFRLQGVDIGGAGVAITNAWTMFLLILRGL